MTSTIAVDERDHTRSEDGKGQRSVLGRVVTVLEAFGEERDVLSLAELTEATGLPRSTAYRFAEQLVSVGWLERVLEGYRVGLRMFELGGMAPQVARLRQNAAPWLLQAHTQSQLTLHLGVLEGTEVVYLDKVPASSAQLPTRLGGRSPAHHTALGKAMLAFEDDTRIDEFIDKGLTKATRATIATEDALRTALIRIRETGIATNQEEAIPGLTCVAAPVRGAGRAIAAISASGPVASFNLRRNAAIVKNAAAGVWQELFGSR